MVFEFTAGFWGFLGTLLGGTVSILSQYFFSKSSANAEGRKILAGKMTEILTYTRNVKNAITALINFSKINLDEIESIDEIKKDFQHFIPECVSQWPDYFFMLNCHFQGVVKHKNFKTFMDVMDYLSLFEKRLNSFVMPAYDIEILKTQQGEIKRWLSKLETAEGINQRISKKYFEKFR